MGKASRAWELLLTGGQREGDSFCWEGEHSMLEPVRPLSMRPMSRPRAPRCQARLPVAPLLCPHQQESLAAPCAAALQLHGAICMHPPRSIDITHPFVSLTN